MLEEMHATNREVDESEAEQEVVEAERFEKLVKSMSRQSRRSHRQRTGSNAVAQVVPPPAVDDVGESSKEKADV